MIASVKYDVTNQFEALVEKREPSVTYPRLSDKPRGAPIREVDGWRVTSCSDATHSWVEITPPEELAELKPSTSHTLAEAIHDVAQHAGDCAILHFLRQER